MGRVLAGASAPGAPGFLRAILLLLGSVMALGSSGMYFYWRQDAPEDAIRPAATPISADGSPTISAAITAGGPALEYKVVASQCQCRSAASCAAFPSHVDRHFNRNGEGRQLTIMGMPTCRWLQRQTSATANVHFGRGRPDHSPPARPSQCSSSHNAMGTRGGASVRRNGSASRPRKAQCFWCLSEPHPYRHPTRSLRWQMLHPLTPAQSRVNARCHALRRTLSLDDLISVEERSIELRWSRSSRSCLWYSCERKSRVVRPLHVYMFVKRGIIRVNYVMWFLNLLCVWNNQAKCERVSVVKAPPP